MKTFVKPIKIRFAHCDPAGIIFYPRYFEILNNIIEDWFEMALDCSFGALLKTYNLGTPTVKTVTEFYHPCRLDDVIDFDLSLTDLGVSSASYEVCGRKAGQIHIRSTGVLVCSHISLSGSTPWPEAIKSKMHQYVQSR